VTIKNALTEEYFNMIVMDCQIFGHEIRTTIGAYDMRQLAMKIPNLKEGTA
jgi:hypothetical protein